MKTYSDRYGECVIGDESYFDDIYREVCTDDTYGFAEIALRDPVGLAVDLGASFGAATRMMRYHWPDAKVVSFEPDDTRYALLARNCPGADCRHNGVIGYEGQEKAVGFIGYGEPWRTDPKHIFGPGPWISAATAFAGLPHPIDLMKIDIEGFEWGVLQEMADLGILPRTIVGEWHFRNVLDGLRALLEPTHDFWHQEPFPGAGPWHLFKARRRA